MATEQPTGNNPDLIPTPPRGFPIPVPAASNRRGTAFAAGLAGLVVGGLLVGGAWLLFGNDGASSSPVSAPDRISDYVRYADAEVFTDNDNGQEIAGRREDWDRRSSERLSAAHDGAGAFVRTYTDQSAENTFMLEVVRAPVPAPYAPYSDPKDLGMERPTEELREFDEVSCLVRNDPSQSYVLTCLRTDDDLTVQISHVSGDLLQDAPAVADLVDAAWQALA